MGKCLALRACPPDGVAFLNMYRLEGRLLRYALFFVCAVIADEERLFLFVNNLFFDFFDFLF